MMSLLPDLDEFVWKFGDVLVPYFSSIFHDVFKGCANLSEVLTL